MKRQSMVVPALVALFAVGSITSSFAQGESTPAPAPAAPAKAASPTKAESGPSKSTKTTTTSKSASHSSTSAKHASTPMLDINTASKEELAKLPAIGEALAEKIIAARPYKSREELVSKGVLTQKEFDKVHTHLTAKHTS